MYMIKLMLKALHRKDDLQNVLKKEMYTINFLK